MMELAWKLGSSIVKNITGSNDEDVTKVIEQFNEQIKALTSDLKETERKLKGISSLTDEKPSHRVKTMIETLILIDGCQQQADVIKDVLEDMKTKPNNITILNMVGNSMHDYLKDWWDPEHAGQKPLNKTDLITNQVDMVQLKINQYRKSMLSQMAELAGSKTGLTNNVDDIDKKIHRIEKKTPKKSNLKKYQKKLEELSRLIESSDDWFMTAEKLTEVLEKNQKDKRFMEEAEVLHKSLNKLLNVDSELEMGEAGWMSKSSDKHKPNLVYTKKCLTRHLSEMQRHRTRFSAEKDKVDDISLDDCSMTSVGSVQMKSTRVDAEPTSSQGVKNESEIINQLDSQMKNIVNFLKQVPTWKAFAKKFDELDSLVGSKGVKSKEVNRILEELSHQVDKYGSLLLKVTNLIDELMSYADNKYIIEGATVRLKDIAHMLSGSDSEQKSENYNLIEEVRKGIEIRKQCMEVYTDKILALRTTIIIDMKNVRNKGDLINQGIGGLSRQRKGHMQGEIKRLELLIEDVNYQLNVAKKIILQLGEHTTDQLFINNAMPLFKVLIEMLYDGSFLATRDLDISDQTLLMMNKDLIYLEGEINGYQRCLERMKNPDLYIAQANVPSCVCLIS